MRSLFLPLAAAGVLALGGCASNYGGEGALAGGALGAGVGALDNDIDAGTAAAVGAGVGAVVGSQIDKDRDRRDGCWRYDRHGERYWDRNC